MLTFHPALRPLLSALLLPALLLFGLKASAQTSSPCAWNPDYNGDNAIGISDLLALLSVFEEVDNDDDGIFDSQDDCVGIIDPCGVCNGTGVDADADGICDDADPCVGSSVFCCQQVLNGVNIDFLGTFGDYTYWSVGDSITWFEAEEVAQCISSNSHLVSIHSSELNQLLTEWTQSRPMKWHWIGLYQNIESPHYSEPYGGWEWIDSSPVDFINWAGAEPNNGDGNENHAHMNHPLWGNGIWNDLLWSARCSGLIQVPLDVNFEQND